MHDWSYRLGFNENAGNFQLHNLFRAEEDAEDRDHVIVHTLDGLDIGQKDNANFSITSDGRSGRMQLLAFEKKLNPNDLFVLSPDELVGAIVTGSATFGPGTVSTELESKLVKLKKDLFNMRFKKTNGPLEDASKFSQLKKDVARILTKRNK